ncbi:MAG: DNA primase [Pirellulales bacterium]
MAAGASLEVKEQIRQAVDIVDLVGGYVALRRQGRGFVGRCPWHDDRRPSLQVDPQRQTFKCWVCDIGGDVFSFVMRVEGIEFRDALQLLADRAGVRLAAAGGKPTSPGDPNDRGTLLRAMAWAEEQYHRCLVESPEAEPARRYLAERGISDASIVQFRIGFSPPDWDWILRRAPGGTFSPPVLERIGLVKARSSGGGFYDRFRGRVLFSIRDVQGRPIALGGRVLPELADADAPKYINSPETPLFSKSNQLYALDAAREAISSQGVAVVVEGYTDCVAAHQAGIRNVVAVLGTALTERHIRLLQRFADSVTLVLDGDEAGQRRTNEVLELFVAQQADLKILTLPKNVDPCDFVTTHGGEAFSQLLREAVDALQHKIRMVTQGLETTSDPHLANRALEEILRTLAQAPRLSGSDGSSARLREDQLLGGLARQFRVSEEQLRMRLTLLRRGRQPAVSSDPVERFAAPAALDFWDAEVLELAISYPQGLPRLIQAVDVAQLVSPVARAIYGTCRRLAAGGAVLSFERLMLEMDDPQAKHVLVHLEDERHRKSASDAESRLAEVIRSIERRKEDAQQRDQLATLHEGQLSDDQQGAILDRLFAQLRNRQTGSPPTDGQDV